MIYGIGTDILQTNRILNGIHFVGDTFTKRVYTDKEQAESCSHPNKNLFYASRFSAKEAVYKALHYVNSNMDWKEIEILTDDNGIPFVILHGKTKRHALTCDVQNIFLSISYETDYCVAVAVAERA